MESNVLKNYIKDGIKIVIPVIISIIILFLTGKADFTLFINLFLFFLIILFILFLIYLSSDYICCIWWSKKYKKILKISKIAILKDEGCNLEKIKFTPENWKEFLEEDYTIQLINISQISHEYIAIINPYGEFYPEENLLYKTSFNKIKEYVMNGGIFVSTAGLAFWYAWNKETERHPSTAKEVYFFQGRMNNNQQIFLEPSFSTLPLNSLTDTMTYEKLGLLTTGFKHPVRTKVYQDIKDVEKCGDIKNIGDTDEIFEFRATREPTQDFVPLLRAKVPDPQKKVEVYPLVYVPDKRGKFIFTGMHMNIKVNDTVLTENGEINQVNNTQNDLDHIMEAQAKKVSNALKNIIEKEKEKFSII